MIHSRSHTHLMKALRRVVATIVTVGMVSAMIAGSLQHSAHAGSQAAAVMGHQSSLEAGRIGEDVQHHGQRANATMQHHHHDHGAMMAADADPAAPHDTGSADCDCGCCCAAHCFAGVIPANASILVPWLMSKKGITAGLFVEPAPAWRLERPPKALL